MILRFGLIPHTANPITLAIALPNIGIWQSRKGRKIVDRSIQKVWRVQRFLQEKSLIWYDGLQQATKDRFNALEILFMTRFANTDTQMAEFRAVFDVKAITDRASTESKIRGQIRLNYYRI